MGNGVYSNIKKVINLENNNIQNKDNKEKNYLPIMKMEKEVIFPQILEIEGIVMSPQFLEI